MTSASADNAYQRMRTRVKPNGGSTCMLYSISGTTCSILIFYFVFKLSRGENGECFCHYQFHFHSVFCSIFQSSPPSSNTTMSLPIVYYSPIVCHSYCPSFTMQQVYHLPLSVFTGHQYMPYIVCHLLLSVIPHCLTQRCLSFFTVCLSLCLSFSIVCHSPNHCQSCPIVCYSYFPLSIIHHSTFTIICNLQLSQYHSPLFIIHQCHQCISCIVYHTPLSVTIHYLTFPTVCHYSLSVIHHCISLAIVCHPPLSVTYHCLSSSIIWYSPLSAITHCL